MRLLIEGESADEFVELLQELRWQSRNGKPAVLVSATRMIEREEMRK